MSKRRLVGIIAGIAAAVVLALAAVMIFWDSRVVLSEEYRGAGGIGMVTTDDLRTMIDDKKSFLLFVSQPGCQAAEKLRGILQELIAEYPIQFFEISFSDLKESGLASEVRFYPSLMVYRQGQLADFLNANDNADTEAYNSLDGLKKWLTDIVILNK